MNQQQTAAKNEAVKLYSMGYKVARAAKNDKWGGAWAKDWEQDPSSLDWEYIDWVSKEGNPCRSEAGNLLLVCDGLAVFDLDVWDKVNNKPYEPSPLSTILEWEVYLGPLPRNLVCQRTWSGGVHILFKIPDGRPEGRITNKTSMKFPGPDGLYDPNGQPSHIDLRASKGGFIVCSPSVYQPKPHKGEYAPPEMIATGPGPYPYTMDPLPPMSQLPELPVKWCEFLESMNRDDRNQKPVSPPSHTFSDVRTEQRSGNGFRYDAGIINDLLNRQNLYQEVYANVAGIPYEYLDGGGHPCPKCGSEPNGSDSDGFSLWKPETGTLLCRGCGRIYGNGNGYAAEGLNAVAFFGQMTYSDACKAVGEYLEQKGYNVDSRINSGTFDKVYTDYRGGMEAVPSRSAEQPQQKQQKKAPELSQEATKADSERVDEVLTRFEEEGIVTVKTGFNLLDEALGGSFGGGISPQFMIIGATPGLGKTSFLLQIANNIADNGQRVLFFSLEQTFDEMVAKTLSFLTGKVSYQQFKRKDDSRASKEYDHNAVMQSRSAAEKRYKKLISMIGDIMTGRIIRESKRFEQDPNYIPLDYSYSIDQTKTIDPQETGDFYPVEDEFDFGEEVGSEDQEESISIQDKYKNFLWSLREYREHIAPNIVTIDGTEVDFGKYSVKHIDNEIKNQIKIDRKPDIVIIDYLQKVGPVEEHQLSDKQRVDLVIDEITNIKKRYRIPIIAISSMNRSSYNHAVGMSSMKESGEIEYTAESLLGLQYLRKPNKGNSKNEADSATEYEEHKLQEDSRWEREIELVILKNRRGQTGIKIPYFYYPAANFFHEMSNPETDGERFERMEKQAKNEGPAAVARVLREYVMTLDKKEILKGDLVAWGKANKGYNEDQIYEALDHKNAKMEQQEDKDGKIYLVLKIRKKKEENLPSPSPEVTGTEEEESIDE